MSDVIIMLTKCFYLYFFLILGHLHYEGVCDVEINAFFNFVFL